MRVRRVALTGGIATGKSYVLARMAAAGVPTIDTDVLARDAVAPGSEGLAAVVRRFGPSILDADGALDRAALAAIVFSDAAARRDLEAIVHPRVRQAADDWFRTLSPSRHPFAVVAVPLLFETGREGEFDTVVATTCRPATQLQRLMSRDRLSEADARRRLAAQLPAADKAARAHHAIATDGTFADTDTQVDALLAALRRQ